MSSAFKFQRLSKSFVAGTSMSSSFAFETHTKSFILQRLQCLQPLYFKDYQRPFTCRDFIVFCPLHFNDYQCLLSYRDFNVFSLYISKTIKFFCLAGTSMSSAFSFQWLSMSFVIQGLQCPLPLHFKVYQSLLSYKDFNVICVGLSGLRIIKKGGLN